MHRTFASGLQLAIALVTLAPTSPPGNCLTLTVLSVDCPKATQSVKRKARQSGRRLFIMSEILDKQLRFLSCCTLEADAFKLTRQLASRELEQILKGQPTQEF